MKNSATKSSVVFFSFATAVLIGCGGSSKPIDVASSTGLVSVVVKSSTLMPPGPSVSNTPVLLDSIQSQAATACSLTIGGVVHTGKCITPLKMVAKVHRVGITKPQVGVQLLSLSSAPAGSGLDGPFGVLGLASFDFSNPVARRNDYSDDGLANQVGNLVFDNVVVELGALQVQLDFSSNANITNKYWTVRYPFVDQQLQSNSTFIACALSSSILSLFTNASNWLYPSPTGFKKGDILLCEKSSASATCADSEFLWVDAASGLTLSSRPSTPLMLFGSRLFTGDSCDPSRIQSKVTFGYGPALRALVASPFLLTKATANGKTSYIHNTGCSISSGTCTGVAVTGSTVTATLDFALTGSIFSNGTVDIDTAAEVNLRKHLNKTLFKSIYIDANKTDSIAGSDPGVSAVVSISLTN